MGQKRQRTDKNSADERERERSGKPQTLEWIVGSISAVLVVAMIGFILYQALSATSDQPMLDVVAEQVAPAENGFLVEFQAVNRGDKTAAGVEIEGSIERDGQTIETSQVTLDYVPGHSRKAGGLVFEQDPRSGSLRLQAKGFTDP